MPSAILLFKPSVPSKAGFIMHFRSKLAIFLEIELGVTTNFQITF